MASKNRQKDNLRKAFEVTVSRVARLKKGIDEDTLHRISMLGSMRLVVLRNLWSHGYIEACGLAESWDDARDMGCPLLDPELDEKGPDPVAVIESCVVPDDVTDPAKLFERLGDMVLSRKGKSNKYKTTLRRASRRRKGAFFTPDWMAERLVNMALGPVLQGKSAERIFSLRIADPACGDGRLLAKSLDSMLDALGVEGEQRVEASRNMVENCLRGVELDPICAALARTTMWLCCDPAKGPVEGLEHTIVTGDSLLGSIDTKDTLGVGWKTSFAEVFDGNEPGFDVIVANPPFEVLTGFSKRKGLKDYSKKIRKSGYDLALSGSLNTYRLFLERCLSLMADGGRMGIVLPFGFMMDRFASKLRSHILRSGWIEQVHAYPESTRSFDGVGQSVILLAVHKKDGSNKSILLKAAPSHEVLGTVSVEELKILDPKELVLPLARPASISLAARMSSACSSSVGELADGMVGELDQTKFRECMSSEPTETLLVRGVHMAPYDVDLNVRDCRQRWVDMEKFDSERAGGRWRHDITEPRLVQTGIVNMEASRRLVAAIVPTGTVLGNSVNYWVPKQGTLLDRDQTRWYLLAYLNSTPAEWRFRLSSSNNNVNLYEIRSLPLPGLTETFPSDRIETYLDGTMDRIRTAMVHPLGMVRQITAGWGAPGRTDRVVAMLLGRVAQHIESVDVSSEKGRWLEHLLDHLVNWHLGMDEPDLDYMLHEVPVRAWSTE